MKMKKVFVIIGVIVFVAVLAFNISIKNDIRTGAIGLLNIAAAPEANAECYEPSNGAGGRCMNDGYQEPFCFYDAERRQCNPTRY